MPGYAAALAALRDEQLLEMLSRRADLRTGQVPASFAELANRAGAPGSIQAALALLDAGTLQLAELLAILGAPTTTGEIAAAAGPELTGAALAERLGALVRLGLAVPAADGTVSGPRGLAHAFARPGTLGPPVAELAKIGVSREQLTTVAAHLGGPAEGSKPELVRVVSRLLADPAVVRPLAAAAPAPAAALLDRARAADGQVTVTGTGGGRYASHPDTGPATWLLERGLLLPATYERLVVPREAEVALRGGWVFPHWPEPPALPGPCPFPPPGDGAVAAAHRLALAAEGCAALLDRAPLPLIKNGTVSLRDLRRLAQELDLAEDECAFLLDLLEEAGVLTPGGPWGSRSVGLTDGADAWLAGTRADRWVSLAAAWRAARTPLEEHFLPRHGVTPADGETLRPFQLRPQLGAPERRASLLETLTTIPSGHGVAPAAVAAALRWQRPRRWKAPQGTRALPRASDDAPVHAVLSAAALLGLATVSGRGSWQANRSPEPGERFGRANRSPEPSGRFGQADGSRADLGGPGLGARAWLAGDDRALAETAAAALGDGARAFVIAGDLSVVAPGGLAPDVDRYLSAMADRVSTGGAATWRIDATTLRRALDGGETGESLLAFLRAHSQTPLPASLTYMVTDTQRRHGRLRVGAAETYLRGDAALVAELARSPAGRRLGLREIAPGVLVTATAQEDVLAALRKTGEAPVAEAPDGTLLPESGQPVRHAHRPHPAPAPAPAAAVALTDPRELLARLRAAMPPPSDPVDPPVPPAQPAAQPAAPGGNGTPPPWRRPVSEAHRG